MSFTNFGNKHNLIEDPTDWLYVEEAFSEEDIKKVLDLIKKFPASLGTTEKIANTDLTIRKSQIRWIPDGEDTRWLYDKILSFVDYANDQYWKFNLYDVKESLQYTEYEEDGGHYDWHLDLGGGDLLNQRKISVSVQLSESDEYEGGDLEILHGVNTEVGPRKKGTIIMFPSFLLHRVTPVTKGTRKSLVIWVGGGSFK